MKFNQRVFAKQHLFAAFPLALNELHDAAAKAVANAASEHAERRGALAFAVASQNNHQAFVDCSCGNIAVDIGFLSLHRALMTRVTFGSSLVRDFFVIGLVGHS